MRWEKGYTSSCYITTVDRDSWRDNERIDITDGKISRSTSELRESANVTCVNYDQSAERWIRIWMDTRQEGESAHTAVFTGLAVSPGRDINGRLITNDIDCYSVLKPAQDVLLRRGWYAPAGANGALLAADLLGVTPAPKEVAENSPTLSTSYIAENKETHLSMALKLIDAINWRIRITGEGVIQILPKAIDPIVTFDCLEYDAIEPKLSTGFDWFSCPNVFRAVKDGSSAVARDDNPDSVFSTVSRGREIWMEESSCKLNNTETLQEYAERRLKEEQRVVYSADYDRRFHPDINVTDMVRLHYPEQNIDGLFTVKSQSIDLNTGGATAEKGETYGNL